MEVGVYDFADELSGKYEQGVEQEKMDSAMRMIEDGDLTLEKVAMYSGLTLEQVLELEKELQPV